jgi:hypothetical protein
LRSLITLKTRVFFSFYFIIFTFTNMCTHCLCHQNKSFEFFLCHFSISGTLSLAMKELWIFGDIMLPCFFIFLLFLCCNLCIYWDGYFFQFCILSKQFSMDSSTVLLNPQYYSYRRKQASIMTTPKQTRYRDMTKTN